MQSALRRSTALLSHLRPTTSTTSFAAQSVRMSSTAGATDPAQLAAGGETDHGIKQTPERAQLVQDVIALFSSKPTVENLKKNWAPDAVFEDPIAIAKGYEQYSSQWFGMPKAFPKSETVAWKVVKDEPQLIEYEQRQKYTIALINTVKEMASLIRIELNPEGKIVRLEDRWDNKPLPSGGIAKSFRGLNGKFIVPTLISVPKEGGPK